MEANRREFLKGTAWMGAAALAAGCTGILGTGPKKIARKCRHAAILMR